MTKILGDFILKREVDPAKERPSTVSGNRPLVGQEDIEVST